MPLGKAGTIKIRAHHSKILRVPSAVVQKTPPRPGVSAGDFPANADWLKVVHGSKAKFRLVRGVACRAARREELADCTNEFLEESSDHFSRDPKIAGRTFTGGPDIFLNSCRRKTPRPKSPLRVPAPLREINSLYDLSASSRLGRGVLRARGRTRRAGR
jgi:hypothetical protein